jgi:hypothetical protein
VRWEQIPAQTTDIHAQAMATVAPTRFTPILTRGTGVLLSDGLGEPHRRRRTVVPLINVRVIEGVSTRRRSAG